MQEGSCARLSLNLGSASSRAFSSSLGNACRAKATALFNVWQQGARMLPHRRFPFLPLFPLRRHGQHYLAVWTRSKTETYRDSVRKHVNGSCNRREACNHIPPTCFRQPGFFRPSAFASLWSSRNLRSVAEGFDICDSSCSRGAEVYVKSGARECQGVELRLGNLAQGSRRFGRQQMIGDSGGLTFSVSNGLLRCRRCACLV